MRSKKGFTLIELLAVIVILAVIALIATPIVLNIIEKAKKSAFLDSAYGIIKSGENYYAEKLLDGIGMIEDKTFLFDEGKPEGLKYSGTTPTGGTITITKDGKVGIAIHNGTWCATKSKDTSEVNITKYEDGKCLIPDTAKDPVITLNGNKTISLKQGITYQEEGATARTVDGTALEYQTEITKNGVKVNSVDSSVIGTVYKITYTAESNGKKASVNRSVTIIDGTAPTITFNPEVVTLKLNEVMDYDIYTGVTINDNEDGPIEANRENVKTTGELRAEIGEHKITYEVKDKAGNIATKIRTFKVIANNPSVADKVEESPETNTNDPDGNRRYVGANPNNYVRFNNELWRIIGIFNGQAKIIRNDFYSTKMAWDTNNVNNWATSTLKTTLNGIYLNSIEATSKSYIDQSHIWNLGGPDWNTGTRAVFYNNERGTNVYSDHSTTWTGAIGLMYPSDWAYASSSTSSACDSTELYNWNTQSICYTTSWLHNSSCNQWTLTPHSEIAYRVFIAYTGGYVNGNGSATSAIGVRPVLYLKSSTKITSGTGTSTDPFILGI